MKHLTQPRRHTLICGINLNLVLEIIELSQTRTSNLKMTLSGADRRGRIPSGARGQLKEGEKGGRLVAGRGDAEVRCVPCLQLPVSVCGPSGLGVPE